MSIRDDFQPYWDGNGLLAPNPVPLGTIRGSDNGIMFSSEFYIMLKKSGFLTKQDLDNYITKIQSCVGQDRELHRAPGDISPDEVDDYYAVYAGMKILGLRPFFKLPLRLWRQPQLAAAMISAKFPSLISPFHHIVRLIAFPLYFVACVTLLISCWNAPTSDTDARRLSWHLWQATKGASLMCWFAGRVWLRRLYKTYPNGMKDVAAIYYQPHPNNPYSKYWITE
jgi:hypothetical protein